MAYLWAYQQASAQREHDKIVSVFVGGMCITQRKIVSNYCCKQCSNKYCLQNIVLFDDIYRNNRNISLNNSEKNL